MKKMKEIKMVITLDKINILNGSKWVVFGDKMVPPATAGMTAQLHLKSG